LREGFENEGVEPRGPYELEGVRGQRHTPSQITPGKDPVPILQ